MINKELTPPKAVIEGLQARLGEGFLAAEELAAAISPAAVSAAAEYLLQAGYEFLADITAVDYQQQGCFRLLYQIGNYQNGDIITLKVDVPREQPQVASLAGVWRSADWLEREVYDMFGIEFLGHPNLRRILMWEGYEGWPLRKDFQQKPNQYQGRRRLD